MMTEHVEGFSANAREAESTNSFGEMQTQSWILITCDNKMRHDYASTSQFSCIRRFISVKVID